MTIFRPLLTLALTVILAAVPSSAEAAKKKKSKGGQQGVVESVQIEQDSGSIDIKTTPKKKKGGPAKEVKLQVNKDTKVELLSGKKKNQARKPGTLADIKRGSRVVITANRGTAEKIGVLSGKKKSKKKATS